MWGLFKRDSTPKTNPEEKEQQIRRAQLNELTNQQLVDDHFQDYSETNLEILKIQEHEKYLLSTTFLKHYNVQEQLSYSGEGVVYRVRCVRPLTDRKKNYAMKMILHYDSNVGSIISQQLTNEYIILNQLCHHSHIVNLYHQFYDIVDPMRLPKLPPMAQLPTKSLFLIYEYHQKTLKDVADEFKSSKKIFSEDQLIRVLSQILSGLLFLEENSVVHRDLKLNNILVKGDLEHIILTDFGLAIYLPEKPGIRKMMMVFSGYGQFLWGNSQYQPPEIVYFTEKQAKLNWPISKFFPISEVVDYSRSDLWSVGKIMYELVGIQLPSSKKEISIIPEIPNYSEKLNKIFQSMLNPSPLTRPNIRKVLKSLTKFSLCKEIVLEAVLKDVDEFEYREIRKKVEESLSDKHGKQLVVEDIKRVFNPKLEMLWKKQKKEMIKPDTVVSLFHGTSTSSIQEIIVNGFKIPTTASQPVAKMELLPNEKPKITYKPCGEDFLNNTIKTEKSIFEKSDNNGTEFVAKRDLLFGCGIYFSSSSTKCSAYSKYGNSNQLLLCDVAVGKHKKLTESDPNIDYFNLKSQGYDSIFCPGGDSSVVKIEEFVVYHPLQPLPRYVITFRSVKITPEESKTAYKKFLHTAQSRRRRVIPTLLQMSVQVLKRHDLNGVFQKVLKLKPDFLPTLNYLLENELGETKKYDKIWKIITKAILSTSHNDVLVSLAFLGNFFRDNHNKDEVPPLEILSYTLRLLKSPNEAIVWHALRVLWNACFLNVELQKKVFKITPEILFLLEDLIFSQNRSICERAAGLVWNLSHHDQEICYHFMKSQLLPSFMEILYHNQGISYKKNNFIRNCFGATANLAFHFPEEVKTVYVEKGLPNVIDQFLDNQYYKLLVTRLVCNMIAQGKIEKDWEEEGYIPLTNLILYKKEKESFPNDSSDMEISPRLRWVPNSERTNCKGCNTEFGVLIWKHHCRGCGEVFCVKCVGDRSTVRLCVICVKSWEKDFKTVSNSNIL